jgi:hypothetical protein
LVKMDQARRDLRIKIEEMPQDHDLDLFRKGLQSRSTLRGGVRYVEVPYRAKVIVAVPQYGILLPSRKRVEGTILFVVTHDREVDVEPIISLQ